MRGMGSVYKRGPVWWIRYSHRGRKYRESSKSPERADALALLRQRLGDVQQGRLSALAEERVTFEELSADYLQERAVRGVDRQGVEVVEGTCQQPRRILRRDAGGRYHASTSPRIRGGSARGQKGGWHGQP